MKLEIKISDNLEAVNSQFMAMFTLLKLEFYRKDSKFLKENMLNHNALISEINPNFKGFEFEMNVYQSVNEFEADLEDKLGFPVQIFRKSGKLWLQTIATDSWSLFEQQEEALESQRAIETEEIGDYHEQE